MSGEKYNNDMSWSLQWGGLPSDEEALAQLDADLTVSGYDSSEDIISSKPSNYMSGGERQYNPYSVNQDVGIPIKTLKASKRQKEIEDAQQKQEIEYAQQKQEIEYAQKQGIENISREIYTIAEEEPTWKQRIFGCCSNNEVDSPRPKQESRRTLTI